MVYPGAMHSRFEHSLGVYWLAGEAVHKLKAHQVCNLESSSMSNYSVLNISDFFIDASSTLAGHGT